MIVKTHVVSIASVMSDANGKKANKCAHPLKGDDDLCLCL